jgi:hypothetical protein
MLETNQRCVPEPQGFDAIRRRLNLVLDSAEAIAEDTAYAYSGYAPITVRLVERAVKPPSQGWMSLEEPLKVKCVPLSVSVGSGVWLALSVRRQATLRALMICERVRLYTCLGQALLRFLCIVECM